VEGLRPIPVEAQVAPVQDQLVDMVQEEVQAAVQVPAEGTMPVGQGPVSRVLPYICPIIQTLLPRNPFRPVAWLFPAWTS
jgi:hypothetical protein